MRDFTADRLFFFFAAPAGGGAGAAAFAFAWAAAAAASTAKFAPKTNWNTLYPEKRLRLEKKSPVARKDLAPAGNFETYAKTYPGLYSALSGLPMGETTPFLGSKPAEPPADAPKK